MAGRWLESAAAARWLETGAVAKEEAEAVAEAKEDAEAQALGQRKFWADLVDPAPLPLPLTLPEFGAGEPEFAAA